MPSSPHLAAPSLPCPFDLCLRRANAGQVASIRNCRLERGATNGRWCGGRTRHKRDYVLVYAPGHPRAKSNPYVFEHILVAEEPLGRHLAPDETIHHRNGLRDDNRPENLGARSPDPLRGCLCTSNNAHGSYRTLTALAGSGNFVCIRRSW